MTSLRRPAAHAALAFAFALALASARCGSDGGDDGPGGVDSGYPASHVAVLDPGAGEPNAAPLVVMNPGTHLVYQGGLHQVVAAREADGVVRVEWSDGEVDRWRDGTLGWELVQIAPGVDVPEALMLVPHEARLGMRWTTGPYTLRVVDRQTAVATPWGAATVWTLEREGGAGTKRLRYVEGRGLLDEPLGAVVPKVLESGVVALAAGPTEPEVARSTLSAVTWDGEPVLLGVEVDQLFAVDGESGPSLSAFGENWQCVGAVSCTRALRPDATCTGLVRGGGGLQPNAAPPYCLDMPVQLSTMVVRPEFGPSSIASPPPRWRVWPVVDGQGALASVDADADDTVALWRDGSGEAIALVREGGRLGRKPLDGGVARQRVGDRLGRVASALSLGGEAAFATWAPIAAGEESAVPLAFLTASGGSATASLPADGALSTPAPGPWLGFDPTVQVGLSERRLLVARGDRVDEVVVDAAGAITVTRLARFAVPAEHFLSKAVRLDADTLLVVTGSRTDGPGAGFAAVNGFDVRDGFLWTVRVTPQALTPAPALAVNATASGEDAVVCAPGLTAAAVSGWSLGGEPAAAGPADAGCVLLTRAGDADPGAVGGWVLEGELPGIGRLVIALAAPAPSATGPLWAAGADGRFMGSDEVFDALGLAEQVTAAFVPRDAFPDGAGDGAWGRGTDSGVVHLAPDGARVEVAAPRRDGATLPVQPNGVAAGGGVLAQTVNVATRAVFWVPPEGDAPVAVLEGRAGWQAARALDGTVCLLAPVPGVACASPLGVTFEIPMTAPLSSDSRILPLADARFAVLADDGSLWRVDAAAGAVTDRVQAVHANVMWSPVARVTIGLEYIWAERHTVDGRSGDLQRGQLSTELAF
ncbi:MAG: hypothetical protein KC635_09350 [Myxococcales bacterium]|nr:hypothetical protein [Myxococcales bacterium]